MNSSVKHIFVGGVMRSGTSLLQRVICTSDDTNSFINGCRYLTGQLELYVRYAGPDSLFIDDYFENKKEFRDFTQSIIEHILYETWACNGRPNALVLKNPELSLYIPWLADLLRDAKFVMSVREPKDTITSMIKVGRRQKNEAIDSFLANVGSNIDVLCDTFNNYYEPTLRSLKTPGLNLESRVLFVRYEDTVNRPEDTIAAVSRFCGISPGLLPKDGACEKSSNTEKISQHAKWRTYLTELSSQPISADSIGSYGSVLSAADCVTIDERCKAFRKVFKYI
jgi:hypothetical protein